MAAFVFNIALGRHIELMRRVDADDPTNSALVIVVLAGTGLEADGVLKDKETLDALIGAGAATNEVTNTNYARKVLTQADIATPTPDHGNDRTDADIPDQTWTSVGAGDPWAKFVVCYDPDSTTGTDTTIVPLTCHDFVRIPDGTNITAQIASAGFSRAS